MPTFSLNGVQLCWNKWIGHLHTTQHMLVQRTSCASQQHIFVCEESMTWILRDRFNSCFYLPALELFSKEYRKKYEISLVFLSFTLWLAQKTRTAYSTRYKSKKPRSIKIRSSTFPSTFGSLVVLILTWFLIGYLRYFPFFWLAVVITLVFVLRYSIEKRNKS